MRITFEEPNGRVVRAVRGKTVGALRGDTSFQWTAAVKAFSLLVVTAKLSGVVTGSLTGSRGSAASALDFALGKPPRWISDIFTTSVRAPLNFFRRTNPELKYPGPVTVGLNPLKFSCESLSIELDGIAVTGTTELKNLLAVLSDGKPAEEAAVPSTQSSLESKDPFSAYFENVFAEEVWSSLSRVRTTSPQWCRVHLEKLSKDQLFARLTKSPQQQLAKLCEPQPSRIRFGIPAYQSLERYFPKGLRILSTFCHPGFIAIAEYIRMRAKIPVTFDPLHLYGVELMRRVLAEGESDIPTVLVTGLGPSSPFINERRCGYSLFMLGPALSHRLLTINSDTKPSYTANEIHMVIEEPTSVQFNFENFLRAGSISKDDKVQHTEPDTILQIAANGDRCQTLTWFPYTRVIPHLLKTSSTFSPQHEPYVDFTLIFANTAVTSNSAASHVVQMLVRDAWLSLLEEPQRLQAVTRSLMNGGEYLTYVRRALGLQYLASFNSPPPSLAAA